MTPKQKLQKKCDDIGIKYKPQDTMNSLKQKIRDHKVEKPKIVKEEKIDLSEISRELEAIAHKMKASITTNRMHASRIHVAMGLIRRATRKINVD